MTIRANLMTESPEHDVLFIEDLRRILGIEVDRTDDAPLRATSSASPSPNPSSPTLSPLTVSSSAHSSSDDSESPLQALLIGHDMKGDFKNMRKDGIEVGKYLSYSGCLDTHVVIEDSRAPLPKGLSGLMEHYGFAECHWSSSKKGKTSRVFDGAHNAGNDAVATLKVAIAQALDVSITACGGDEIELDDGRLDVAFEKMDTRMILLAYDTESATNANYKPTIKNRITEHGFAWLWLADIVGIAPEPNGIHWHPFIQAKHFINDRFRTYKNTDWVVGNPMGFWPKYGKSQFYHMEDSFSPFDAMFRQLAMGEPFRPRDAIVEDMRSLGLESSAFPSLTSTTRVAVQNQWPKTPVQIEQSARGSPCNRGRGSTRGQGPAKGRATDPRAINSTEVISTTKTVSKTTKTVTSVVTTKAKIAPTNAMGKQPKDTSPAPKPFGISWAAVARRGGR